MVSRCTISTPLGDVIAAMNDGALTGLWFTDQKHLPAAITRWPERPDEPVFAALKSWLKDFFDGQPPQISFPMCPQGTPFQTQIWQMLSGIPYGSVTTYGALAKRLAEQTGGSKVSARAVGGAVGRNPISLLIPCHRVIGSNGNLTGYAGGIDRKIALLRLENALSLEIGSTT